MRRLSYLTACIALSSCISAPPESALETCSDCSDVASMADTGPSPDAPSPGDADGLSDASVDADGQDVSMTDAASDAGDLADTSNDAGGTGRYRKPITVDHEQVDRIIRGFPVLVQGVDSDLRDLVDNANQLHFIDATDGTVLPHEIELFVPNEGRLTAWVRVPEVRNDRDVTFYMVLNEGPSDVQPDRAKLWDSYAAVWHLSVEDPTSGNTVFDSTANGNDGTTVAMARSARLAVGLAGSALEFDGVDDRIDVPDDSSLRTGNVFVSAWVRVPDLSDNANVVSKPARSVTANNNDSWQIYIDPTNVMRSVTSHAGAPTGYSSGAVPAGSWNYLALVYDGNTVSHYINGNRIGQWNETGALDYDTDPVYIGAELDSTNFIAHHQGAIDEVRISAQPRGAGWISTEFANQGDPETFLTWGALEAF